MNSVEGEILIVDWMQGASDHSGFHLFITVDPSWNPRICFCCKNLPCAAFRGEAVVSHMGRCVK